MFEANESGRHDKGRGRMGVLLVNTGTPDAPTAEAVRSYLSEFLMDDRIAPVNKTLWKVVLFAFILPRRSRRSAAKYERIWTPKGSPLTVYHGRLAKKLESFLAARGQHVSVEPAMSYGNPSIASALGRLEVAGCTRLVVLPLYPQPALSTTAAAVDAVKREVRGSKWEGRCEFVEGYFDNPLYIEAIAESVRRSGFDASAGDKLFLSYHSVPLADIEEGDMYAHDTAATSKLIAEALDLAESDWSFGYQCRFDKARAWLSPFAKDALADLAESGARRVYLVCPNFAEDCLETLYDVPEELAPAFVGASDERELIYVPCLNDTDAHADTLCSVINRSRPLPKTHHQ